MGEWLRRLDRHTEKSRLTLVYDIDLPFDGAKRLENALADLPGTAQEVSFPRPGAVHVRMAGADVFRQFGMSADTNGVVKDAPTTYPVAERLCNAVHTVGGTLTAISVRGEGFTLDNGKLPPPPPVP